MDNFDQSTALEFTQQRHAIGRRLSSEEWTTLFRIMSARSEAISVLPLRLEKLLRQLDEESQWGFNEARIYLENEAATRYSLMAQENAIAVELLYYLSHLHGESVSMELIRALLISKSSEDLTKALNYLVRTYNVRLNADERTYQIHQLVQDEIRVAKNKVTQSHSTDDTLGKLAFAVNSLLTSKTTDTSLYAQAEHLLSKEWPSKATSVHCADLYQKLAQPKHG